MLSVIRYLLSVISYQLIVIGCWFHVPRSRLKEFRKRGIRFAVPYFSLIVVENCTSMNCEP